MIRIYLYAFSLNKLNNISFRKPYYQYLCRVGYLVSRWMTAHALLVLWVKHLVHVLVLHRVLITRLWRTRTHSHTHTRIRTEIHAHRHRNTRAHIDASTVFCQLASGTLYSKLQSSVSLAFLLPLTRSVTNETLS